MGAVYDFAAQFLSRGVATFPVRYRDKKPALPVWEIYQDVLPTEKQLRAWFPVDFRNYGIVLGWQSLAVLDFDDMALFYKWQAWQLENAPQMDNAFTVKTRRGLHIYFTLLEQISNMRMPSDEEIELNKNILPGQERIKLPAIDFKAHGYTIGPQSTHPSGFVYRALNDLNFPVVERLSDILPDETLSQASAYNDDYQVNENFVYANPPGDGGIDLDAMPGLTPMETAKSRYRIERFFPAGKVDRGGFIHVICPFHQDKAPSAWINIQSQIFGCHSCNMRPMSVIGFYAAIHKITIKEAIREMSR